MFAQNIDLASNRESAVDGKPTLFQKIILVTINLRRIRLRQIVFRICNRAVWPFLYRHFPSSWLLKMPLWDHVWDASAPAGPFFFRPDERKELAAIARDRFAEEVRVLVLEASEILAGSLNLLEGKGSHQMPDPLDWHWLLPGDPDIEWPHALNRFRCFARTLGASYLVTGDCKFRERIRNLQLHWISHNPLGRRIGWAAMTTALRLIEWTWVYHLTASPDSPDEYEQVVLRSMHVQVRYLMRHLEYELSDNHLLFNLGAILFVLWSIPGLRFASKEEEQIRQEFEEEVLLQFRGDGFNVEQSTHYHVLCTRLVLELIYLARRAARTLDRRVVELAEKMTESVSELLSPEGTLPLFSDAFTSFFAKDINDDIAVVLALGAILWKRSDFKANYRPGLAVAWVLGSDGLLELDQVVACTSKVVDYIMLQSGYVFSRSGRTEFDTMLGIDAGPFGFPLDPGHAHADQLSFVMYALGHAMCVDPGTFDYHMSTRSIYYKQTGAHNTLSLEGKDQSQVWGLTRWGHLVHTQITDWESQRKWWRLGAWHDGYKRQMGVRHHRTFLHLRHHRLILLQDSLSAHKTHPRMATVHLLFGPTAQTALMSSSTSCRVQYGLDGPYLHTFWLHEGLESSIAKGQDMPKRRGWYAPGYGREIACFSLQLTGYMQTNKTIWTIILAPSKTSSSPFCQQSGHTLHIVHNGEAVIDVRTLTPISLS